MPTSRFLPELFAASMIPFVLTGQVSGQTRWREITLPDGASGAAMTFDPVRGETVLFGGATNGMDQYVDRTFVWNGSEWTLRDPANRPPGRNRGSMAFDAARGVAVLFGGGRTSCPGVPNETWEWDGSNWALRIPATTSPPAICESVMGYDPVRAVTVLWAGGQTVWEWDGIDWRQIQTNGPANVFRAMSWDPGTQRFLVVSQPTNIQPVETWEFDGLTWTQRFPSHLPIPAGNWAAGGGLVHDPNRGSVLWVRSDTWEWTGSDWVQIAGPINPPNTGYGHVLATDLVRQRVVLRSGGRTWEWDGGSWTLLDQGNPPLSASGYSNWSLSQRLTFDSQRERVVLQDERATWEWDGMRWFEQQYQAPFLPREEAALEFHRGSGRTVMFGGEIVNIAIDETWLWDGTNWTQAQPATRPAARTGHAMVYDSRRDTVLMYGGFDGLGAPLFETWEWDGNDWLQAAPTVSPPHGLLAYDSTRGEAILVSNANWSQPLLTWRWDGTDWSQLSPAVAPPGRFRWLVDDGARERLVLNVYVPPLAEEIWEWDGVVWRPNGDNGTVQQFGVGNYAVSGAVYDPVRAQLLTLIGEIGWWIWDFRAYEAIDPATFVPFGSGCTGTAGTPTLRATGLPWLGDSLDLGLADLPPAAIFVLVLGLRDDVWNGSPLPIDLSPFGMTGCSQLVAADASLVFTADPAGRADVALAICNCPNVLGVRFFQQGLAFDPLANPAGLTVTNAGAATIGSR